MKKTYPTWMLFVLMFAASMLPISGAVAQQERILDREERSNVNVFRNASPSVVNIATQKAIVAQQGDVKLNIGKSRKTILWARARGSSGYRLTMFSGSVGLK